MLLIVLAQDEGLNDHRDGGDSAHDEHGQASHMRRASLEPVDSPGDHENFKGKQPARIDQSRRRIRGPRDRVACRRSLDERTSR